ncbi:MAG: hypothetical protein M1576_03815, partial [Deltaproteobacteria bacterium]|nr:hypothetical protein [Deltaproteobacteria bacterium]
MESQKLGEILIKHGAAKKDDVNSALLIQEKIRNGLKKGQQLQDIKLGEILVKNDIITASQLKQALEEQELSGGSIGKQLSKLGFVKDSELVSFLSKEFGAATINLLSSEIPSDVIKLIPPDTALKYRVVPYKRQGNTLYLAVSDPTKVTVLEDIKFYTGLNVEVVLASESEINQALSSYYNASTILTDHKDYIDSISIEDTNEKIDISEMQKSSSEKPIIQFVNKVLADGIRRGASDLHFEPYETKHN